MADLIACVRCASLKARCDRQMPCSQCVAKGSHCQPRYSSRRPRAAQRDSWRSQTVTNTGSTTPSVQEHIEQFPAYLNLSSQVPNGVSVQQNHLFDFSDAATEFLDQPMLNDGTTSSSVDLVGDYDYLSGIMSYQTPNTPTFDQTTSPSNRPPAGSLNQYHTLARQQLHVESVDPLSQPPQPRKGSHTVLGDLAELLGHAPHVWQSLDRMQIL